MFSGIVTDVGRVRAVRYTKRYRRFETETSYDLSTVAIGASIRHAGCYLTVVERADSWFAVEVSTESLTPARWPIGARVGASISSGRRGLAPNSAATSSLATSTGLARWFRSRPRMAVTGRRSGRRRRCNVTSPRKGSIALDGVSLTVNEVEGEVFGVNLIPDTWEATTLCRLHPGSRVNLEIDMLARYPARWQETA